MKLTKDEKAWVKKLQTVLDECPSKRLASFTIGDPMITLYDRKKYEAWEIKNRRKLGDVCGDVEKAKADFGYDGIINFPFNVDSTAG